MKIKNLDNNEVARFSLFLKEVVEREGKNGAYCTLRLKPAGEPEISANMFKNTRAGILGTVEEGKVVSVDIRRSDYNGAPSYVINHIEPDPDSDISNFVEHSEKPGKVLLDWTGNTVLQYAAARDEGRVFKYLFDKYRDKLVYWPGAYSVHHAYMGGLIEHTSMVVAGCRAACLMQGTREFNDFLSAPAEKNVQAILKMLDSPGEAYAIAREAVPALLRAPGTETALTLASMKIAYLFLKIYKKLDREYVLTGTALRGISHAVNSPMAEAVGGNAADVLYVQDFGKNSEKKRMLIHILASNGGEGGDIHPVIAEAYAAYAARETAKLILEPGRMDIALALTAAALHDIGKIRELDSSPIGISEYAIDGNLYKHLVLGLMEVKEACRETHAADCTNLMHCIASHHGKKEWGALVEPVLPEARLVAMMDLLDSRMNLFQKGLEGLEPGEKSDFVKKYLHGIVYRPLEEPAGQPEARRADTRRE